MKQQGVSLIAKRALDRSVAIVALLLSAPILCLAALLVWTRIGSPVIFSQQRPGLNARPFSIYKLRTMTDARDGSGALLPDDQRLTRLGRFLRSTSIDELPQLWNLLRGDLSLVGPRPLLTEYLQLYTPEEARRHDVLPGITGWAQIHGRNRLRWKDRFALDVWYVDHWSLALDFKILLVTLFKVLRRDGISEPGHATASPYTGGHRTPPGANATSH